MAGQLSGPGAVPTWEDASDPRDEMHYDGSPKVGSRFNWFAEPGDEPDPEMVLCSWCGQPLGLLGHPICAAAARADT